MKVEELKTGPVLDYWVAKSLGRDPKISERSGCYTTSKGRNLTFRHTFNPSEDWKTCGWLLEKFDLELFKCITGEYVASEGYMGKPYYSYGRTRMEAICRLIVQKAYGNEVPDE